MNRKIDRAALSEAVAQSKVLRFPGHPEDWDFAGWVLELAELDGHIVGLATTALGSDRKLPIESAVAARHEASLADAWATGNDREIYFDCHRYIRQLVAIERILAGLPPRASRDC